MMKILNSLALSYVFLSLMLTVALANVVLFGDNVTLSFDDFEANFAPKIKGNGECGVYYLAEPMDACSPLTNKLDDVGGFPAFALIARGNCRFEDKVRRAQTAGFKAAIVHDNEDHAILVTMAGNSNGIKIHALFISNAAGEELRKYAGVSNMELWIIPSIQNSSWAVMVISFISLLAMAAVLATCFFARKHRMRRERPHSNSRNEVFHGMNIHAVKRMPSLIFMSVSDSNYHSCTSTTCAICLEDYCIGEKLRVLPCHHKFHAFCVDCWLTAWRPFCPVCKHDSGNGTMDASPPPSENTPLLSPSPQSTILSSIGSSFPSSSAIQITQATSQSRSQSQSVSLRSSPSTSRSLGSSPLASSYPLGYPSAVSPNSTYLSTCMPTTCSGSSPSTQQHLHMLHHSESASSFSQFASAQSLLGC